MKINELITKVDGMDHAINRAKAVANLCKKLGDRPLLYRGFNTESLMVKDLIIKVSNTDRKHTKSGGTDQQAELIQALGITHPVFSEMTPPSRFQNFHGEINILVPLTNEVYWSPVVHDIGSNRRADDKPKPETSGSTLVQKTVIDVEQTASTYKKGWPTEMTKSEVIVDTEEYYLINLHLFLSKYAGRPSRELIDAGPYRSYNQIKDKLFAKKFKTYNNIAWFLENPVISYIEWLHKPREY